MRALIVDDEAPAREELRYQLARLDVFREVEEAETAADALALLQQREYDALFLDIRMPGLSGLEAMKVINELPRRPYVVFVTAYDEYALEGFEVAANDYLLKPVSEKRLRQAMQRLLAAKARTVPERAKPSAWQRLAVEADSRTILLNPAEIRYISAHGDYCHVHTYDRQYRCRTPLAELERKLEPLGFFRAHRGYLVNLAHVVELQPFFSGTYLIKVDDRAASEVPLSRSAARALRETLAL